MNVSEECHVPASSHCSGSQLRNNQVLSNHRDIHYFIKYNDSNKPLPTSHISMGNGGKHSINLHILDYLLAWFCNFFITPGSDARSILNTSFCSKWAPSKYKYD